MEYLAKGPTFIVPNDRYTYGIPATVRGHEGNNKGSYTHHREDDTVELNIGPCMAENISMAKARNIASGWASIWPKFKVEFNKISEPTIRRYILLDGQRLVSVESKNRMPLIFADSHAGFDDDLWLKQFPSEVYE
jgi:hypothetical protein